MKGLILLVEDEQDLLELLEFRLAKEGYETLGFLNTKNVRRALDEEDVDLIIMDRNLPDIEGSEFISLLRAQGVETPVIYLTAKTSLYHIEEGFVSGADDYITKPFEMQELFLRINAVLRRTKREKVTNETVTFRDITLFLQSREVFIDDQPFELTKLEFDLLHTLIENRSIVMKREALLKQVWGKSEAYQSRTVNVAINRLKEKIDPDQSKEYIKTVRGVGYTLW